MKKTYYKIQFFLNGVLYKTYLFDEICKVEEKIMYYCPLGYSYNFTTIVGKI